MDWISVKDKLPDKRGWYLVVVRDLIVCYITMGLFHKYYGIDSMTKGGTWHADGNTTGDVTHWMPLPELPKEEPNAND